MRFDEQNGEEKQTRDPARERPDSRKDAPERVEQGEDVAGTLGPSEGLFRSIVENSSEIVNVVDPDGTLRYASPAIERVMGYRPEEMVGKNVLEYMHPEDLPMVIEETQRALAEPGVARNAAGYRFRHADGSWRHVESTGTYLLDDPRVGGVVVVSRDVSESKRAEEAEERLVESEGRFRSVVEGMGEGLLITDPGDVVLYANPRMEELAGYAAEELMGRPGYELLLPPGRWHEASERNRRRAEGSVERYETPLLRKDGTEFWAEVTATPYRDASGEVVGTLGAIADVTERKEAEERLKESEELHRRRARELDLLHRVRTALASELDPGAVCRAVVEAVAEAYGYVLVSAYLLEDEPGEADGEVLTLQHQVGYASVIERIPLGHGVSGRAVREGRSVLVEDVREDPAFLGAIEGVTSEVCVPLFDGGEVGRRVLGFINVESTGGNRLTGDDLKLLEAVGEHAGTALGRAGLHALAREAEERYRALVENIPAVIYIDDADEANSVIYRSPYVREVLGYEPEEFLSDPEFWQNLLHPEDRERVLDENERTNRTGEPFRIEYRMIRKDGGAVWLRDEAVLIRDKEGNPRFWQGYFADVTERKEAEERLREAEARYRSLVEQLPVSVYRQAVEHGGAIAYASPQIGVITGYTAEEWVADPGLWVRTLHPDDKDRVLAEDALTDETGEPYRIEHRMFHKDGRVLWVRNEAVLVRDVEGRSLHWQGIVSDVTERKMLEQELERRATHDPLTGLPNRDLLAERLDQALSRTKRKGSELAVLFVDLDDFKEVNDSSGHENGDRVLAGVAARLRAAVRPEDTVARLGGDEFVVLLEDANREGALLVVRRIAAALEAPFDAGGTRISVTASIGVAPGGLATKGPEELLRNADRAMYRAKEGGKARHATLGWIGGSLRDSRKPAASDNDAYPKRLICWPSDNAGIGQP